MSTRLSMRPRPVEHTRQLVIIRDESELDNAEGLETVSTTEVNVKSEIQQNSLTTQKPKKEFKEIPVPEVRQVAGYRREYLPLFYTPDTYIRCKGGVNWCKETYVEYDMDEEDERWLVAYNGDLNKLQDEKFEKLIYRLELLNADANQRVMSEPGGTTDWRLLPGAVAQTSNLLKADAITVLQKLVGGRDKLLSDVFDYWKTKRERMGKPLLRRLQAPTNPSDTNPYNVFRPREKVNRPQTRRRRENTLDCYEKLRQMRENITKALELTELVMFRECKKRDMHRLDVDLQRFQVAKHHQPPRMHAEIEAEAVARLRQTQQRAQAGEARLRTYLEGPSTGGAPAVSYDALLKRAFQRKRKRQDLEGQLSADVFARLPLPPKRPEERMLFAEEFSVGRIFRNVSLPAGADTAASVVTSPQSQSRATPPVTEQPDEKATNPPASNLAAAPQLPFALPSGLSPSHVRLRVSRGSRVMLTRCDPFLGIMYGAREERTSSSSLAPPDGACTGPEGHSGFDDDTGGAPLFPGNWVADPTPQQKFAQAWASSLDIDSMPDLLDKATLHSQREKIRRTVIATQQNLSTYLAHLSAAVGGREALRSLEGGPILDTALQRLGGLASASQQEPQPQLQPPQQQQTVGSGSNGASKMEIDADRPAAGGGGGDLPYTPHTPLPSLSFMQAVTYPPPTLMTGGVPPATAAGGGVSGLQLSLDAAAGAPLSTPGPVLATPAAYKKQQQSAQVSKGTLAPSVTVVAAGNGPVSATPPPAANGVAHATGIKVPTQGGVTATGQPTACVGSPGAVAVPVAAAASVTLGAPAAAAALDLANTSIAGGAVEAEALTPGKPCEAGQDAPLAPAASTGTSVAYQAPQVGGFAAAAPPPSLSIPEDNTGGGVLPSASQTPGSGSIPVSAVPGTPPVPPSSKKAAHAAATKAAAGTPVGASAAAQQQKRGPGRPPKSAKAGAAGAETQAQAPAETTPQG